MNEPGMSDPVSPPRPDLGALQDNGRLTYDGMMVGSFKDGQLTVDLGWCKEAGVHVTVKADPAVDRIRSGIVLAR